MNYRPTIWIALLMALFVFFGCSTKEQAAPVPDYSIEFEHPKAGQLVTGENPELKFTVKGNKPVGLEEIKIYLDDQLMTNQVQGIVGKPITVPLSLTDGGHVLSVSIRMGDQKKLKANLVFAYGTQNPPGMAKIPGGQFMMGCSKGDADCEDQEKPEHMVTLPAFYLDKKEVTVQQYKRCLKFRQCERLQSLEDPKQPSLNEPITGIRWEQAKKYCKFEGKSLPSEAQWEYAARANTTAPRYGQLDDIAWYSKNADGKVHPVGQKAPNAWGLYDMLGNVSEWCEDLYFTLQYSRKPDDPHKGASDGRYRVIRGGSWFHSPKSLRASTRFSFHPEEGGAILGFRCARPIVNETK